MSRRSFLLGAVSLAAFGACSSNGGSSASTTSAVVRNTVPLDADPFTLGIASGDPRPTSVILWTRVAPDPLAPDGRGGMPADPVDVRWDIEGREDRSYKVVISMLVQNRPGALAQIARRFSEAGINMRSARLIRREGIKTVELGRLG